MSRDEHLLRSVDRRRTVEELALVLAAAGIPHRVARGAGGWRLLVGAAHLSAASGALEAYEAERASTDGEAPAPEWGPSALGAVVAGLLLGAYVVTGPADAGGTWAHAGSATAELIRRGELWRTVTALTLHANPAHLLGNAVAGTVFLAALGRALGPGLGACLVLLAGAGGNWLTAVLHGTHHSAVGASTAVFGAIGILGGLQAGRRQPRRGAWLPIAGSLALLAMLGTEKGADLTAHLLGLLAGGVLGVGAALGIARPPGGLVQSVLALAALGVLVGAWLLALRAL